ncbi:hypothetical protein BSKO_01093 [Bryopsis sp. KO-2023]|nr:hypothetical protein BSKO_01093 [Bryopsis sp. KO-2023]
MIGAGEGRACDGDSVQSRSLAQKSLGILQAHGKMARTSCEGAERLKCNGIYYLRKKRALPQSIDDPKEASPKRPRLSSRNGTAPNLTGPLHAKATVRDPQETLQEGATLRHGLEEIVHSLVSKAVFSLNGDTATSNVLDAFQSALEKRISSGAIHVQSSQPSHDKINTPEELKSHLKNTLAFLKPPAGHSELNSELVALKKEAAAWARLAESGSDLVAVLADGEPGCTGGGTGRSERVSSKSDSMGIFERLAEMGQEVKYKEIELANLKERTDAARVHATEASTKLLEMRNEKELSSLLPDLKPIDMFRTLLEN